MDDLEVMPKPAAIWFQYSSPGDGRYHELRGRSFKEIVVDAGIENRKDPGHLISIDFAA